MEELYWARYITGENKGLPKDETPTQNDDELDVLGYTVCSPFRWHPSLPSRVNVPESDEARKDVAAFFATLQNPGEQGNFQFDLPIPKADFDGGSFGGNDLEYFIS